jgi:hypothetical protein
MAEVSMPDGSGSSFVVAGAGVADATAALTPQTRVSHTGPVTLIEADDEVPYPGSHTAINREAGRWAPPSPPCCSVTRRWACGVRERPCKCCTAIPRPFKKAALLMSPLARTARTLPQELLSELY